MLRLLYLVLGCSAGVLSGQIARHWRQLLLFRSAPFHFDRTNAGSLLGLVRSPLSVGPAMLYQQIAEKVLKAGEPLLAYDIARFGSGHWPEEKRLIQLRALALACSGAPRGETVGCTAGRRTSR